MGPRQKANLRNPSLRGPIERFQAKWAPVRVKKTCQNERPTATTLARAGLDRLHVGVREAEMVADLVDQHMAHDVAQRLLVLGPVIQDRAAVEPDHVRKSGNVAMGLMRKPNTMKQAEQ